MRAPALAACVALAGCAHASAVRPARAWGGGTAVCNAAGLDGLVGQPATAVLGADVLKRSGARVLRWIPPGAMVTADYRRDRLNVALDAQGRVTRISCN